MANEKILIVDDDEHVIELLKYNLEKNGYKCFTAENGLEALKIANDETPKLILLDLMLPKMDGYEVCKSIRKNNEISSTPIIILSAKGEEFDKILGFELGADDYITKPFSVREVLTRVKVILKRSSLKPMKMSNTFALGNLTIDFEKQVLYKDYEKIEITFKEFALLEILIKNKGRVVSKKIILDKIWDNEYKNSKIIATHISQLRKKLEDDAINPKFIETIPGIGYKFKNTFTS